MSRRALVVTVSLAILGLLQPAAGAGEDEARTRYVVVLDGSAGAVDEAARQLAPEVRPFRTYRHGLRGFAARLTTGEVARLRSRPGVQVVRDRMLHLADTQLGAPWGLDRIDERQLPRDTTYTYTATGSGVAAYVIDTGITASHVDFGGRVGQGVDYVDSLLPANDCNGHGTHVAGTLGGSTYGVAKAVTLVPVRVLNCGGSGWLSNILAGISWVTGNHATGTPAVANMSLGGPSIKVLNQAVKASIADGITYTVAAGNFGTDACNFSPARVAPAITVSASNPKDARPSWANFGSCVDLFAPGTNITSAWWDGQAATISGTSMAAPHVAGVVAQYLQIDPTATPAEVRAAIHSMTTKNKITSAKSLNRHLLFTDL